MFLDEAVSAAMREMDVPDGGRLVAKDAHGNETALPSAVSDVLLQVLRSFAEGGRVVVSQIPNELTSHMAADLLGVSRPTLMKWAKEGHIPSFKVGTHSRFHLHEVLEFDRVRREKQGAAFDELREFDYQNFGPINEQRSTE
ncbi:Helix-turn-helix domain protein [Corynebacterium aquatimens]|nr:Helix-turn-helix domain protein [Corynebacterium aquatimens]